MNGIHASLILTEVIKLLSFGNRPMNFLICKAVCERVCPMQAKPTITTSRTGLPIPTAELPQRDLRPESLLRSNIH
jgi:hypothetical protein